MSVVNPNRDPQTAQLITVTPNPAIDVTYRLPRATWDDVNRVSTVTRRAGGKGINVANVLAQLDHPVAVSGFLGGDMGRALQTLLSASDGQSERRPEQMWLPVERETRCTTVIVDDTTTTLFNEPGPEVSTQDWSGLTELVVGRVKPGDVVTVSGSNPPGTTAEVVGEFFTELKKAGASILVDTSGPLLLTAAGAGVDLVKPNEHELREATGCAELLDGVRELMNRGVQAVAVSMGRDGLSLFHSHGNSLRGWHAAPAEVVHGNPTGAGDAAVAALSLGLRELAAVGAPDSVWPSHLRHAVALSASAVLAPVAGQVDLPSYTRFLENTEVREIDVPV